MKLCPECKVYFSDETDACPLCNAPALAAGGVTSGEVPPNPEGMKQAASSPERQTTLSSGERLSPSENRRMSTELISVSLGIILIVTVGIDFLFSKGITWSRYTSVSLAALWILSAIPLIFWGRAVIVYSVICPSLVFLVFVWSLFSGDTHWFLALGLPVTLACEISFIVPFILISLQKRKGLNIVGMIIADAVFLCAAIDASVGFYFLDRVRLSWSIVVCIAAIPVAGLFFYFHYRVTNQASLRKLFRL